MLKIMSIFCDVLYVYKRLILQCISLNHVKKLFFILFRNKLFTAYC